MCGLVFRGHSKVLLLLRWIFPPLPPECLHPEHIAEVLALIKKNQEQGDLRELEQGEYPLEACSHTDVARPPDGSARGPDR
jgi:hypothetical protein